MLRIQALGKDRKGLKPIKLLADTPEGMKVRVTRKDGKVITFNNVSMFELSNRGSYTRIDSMVHLTGETHDFSDDERISVTAARTFESSFKDF